MLWVPFLKQLEVLNTHARLSGQRPLVNSFLQTFFMPPQVRSPVLSWGLNLGLVDSGTRVCRASQLSPQQSDD